MFVGHPNGTKALITRIGKLKLSNFVVLEDVLVVPEYYVNLMSVYRLAKDNKLGCWFDEHDCLIQDFARTKVLLTGKQVNGLHYFGRPTSGSFACKSSVNPSLTETKLWHSRMGHPSFHVLNVLKHDLDLKDNSLDIPCEICQRAKKTRNPFPTSNHKSLCVGELVHLDLWGPFKVTSREGFKFFLTIVDDYSRAVWVYLLKSKDEVFFNIQCFIKLLKNQFNKDIKCFRTDNGTEFVNNQLDTFLKVNGILHQTSCVYTPQQNGVVERKHRHLLNVARALMFQSGIPLRLWTECVLTATYLINRTPTSILNGKSPYELLLSCKPSLLHLRTFGCLTFASNLNPKTNLMLGLLNVL
jgi:transposase InsO family protein